MWPIHITQCRSALTRKGTDTCHVMNLEGITLREVSPSQKDKHCVTSLLWGSTAVKFVKTESRVTAGSWSGAEGSWCFISVAPNSQDEEFWRLFTQHCVMLLNCTLKHQDGKFYVIHFFPQLKKVRKKFINAMDKTDIKVKLNQNTTNIFLVIMESPSPPPTFTHTIGKALQVVLFQRLFL